MTKNNVEITEAPIGNQYGTPEVTRKGDKYFFRIHDWYGFSNDLARSIPGGQWWG